MNLNCFQKVIKLYHIIVTTKSTIIYENKELSQNYTVLLFDVLKKMFSFFENATPTIINYNEIFYHNPYTRKEFKIIAVCLKNCFGLESTKKW